MDTPSPVPKEPESSKRVMTEQLQSNTTRSQPEGPTLKPAGLEGNAAVNTTQSVNNNPNPNPSPNPYKQFLLTDHYDNLNIFRQTLKSYTSLYRCDLPKHPFLPTHHPTNCPGKASEMIDKFIDKTKSYLSFGEFPCKTDNLTKKERKVLNSLIKRLDIIIKKSDKGDKIVMETVENYVKEALAHLDNENVYHRIDHDINPQLYIEIKNF